MLLIIINQEGGLVIILIMIAKAKTIRNPEEQNISKIKGQMININDIINNLEMNRI